MFGIGFSEMIVIMVVALIFIGPKKLPELAKALGRAMAEFRKATHEIKESLDMDQGIQNAKGDLIDSISGIRKDLDIEDAEYKGIQADLDSGKNSDDKHPPDHEKEINKG